MRSFVGEQFGNYRLTSLLGSGGFADVYLGEHVRIKKVAAVKILHSHISQDESANFQREANIIAQLEHPNIVNVLDFDIKDSLPFLVMDYYAQGTLRKRHGRGEKVPLEKVVSYVKQIAQALQHAHEQKLIHRDIKPDNMLIGRQGEIVLSDFGIAAIAHSTSSMSAQLPIGTIPYMAPEQIQAQARPASDQYALAVVAYEWLCGNRPFEGTVTEVFSKHLMAPPPPLRVQAPHITQDVEDIIFTALQKDPAKRFATVQAFATALESTIKRAAPEVHTSASGYQQNSAGNAYFYTNSAPTVTTAEYIEKSQIFLQKHSYQEALDACNKALQLDPDNVIAHYNASDALVRLKRYAEALNACDRALQLDPNFADAYINKSWAYIEMKRPQEAIASSDQAIRLKPSSSVAYSNKAGALCMLGLYQEALNACNQALILDANNAIAHYNASEALCQLKRFEQALRACERVIQIDPSYVLAYINKGYALIQMKRYEEALVACNQAIQRDPNNAIAHNNACSALIDLGRYQQAYEACERALRLDPNNENARTNKQFLLNNPWRY